VKASAVVRGELVWPGILITALAWTMIAATGLVVLCVAGARRFAR